MTLSALRVALIALLFGLVAIGAVLVWKSGDSLSEGEVKDMLQDLPYSYDWLEWPDAPRDYVAGRATDRQGRVVEFVISWVRTSGGGNDPPFFGPRHSGMSMDYSAGLWALGYEEVPRDADGRERSDFPSDAERKLCHRTIGEACGA